VGAPPRFERIATFQEHLFARARFGYGIAMRSPPLVCVTDVEASSAWYQRLLACRGAHGGRHYEQLVKDGSLILQLHSFDVEDHHGPIGNRADRPYGNGCAALV
jgi:hypothetical protein